MRHIVPVLLVATIFPSFAHSQSRFPLVFSSYSQSAKYGIVALDPESDHMEPPLANECPHLGDGSIDISISDDMRGHLESQGFSLLTACFAFLSEIQFNPETGVRLATFTTKNPAPYLSQGFFYSPELPLSLPHCFYRARPFSDCKWNFNPFTGRKLDPRTPAVTAYWAKLCREVAPTVCKNGASPDELADAVKTLAATKENIHCRHSEAPEPGVPMKEYDLCNLAPSDVNVTPTPDSVLRWNSAITHIIYSNELPDGYGYALNVQWGAGGSGNSAVVKAGIRGTRAPPRVNVKELKKLWQTGSQVATAP